MANGRTIFRAEAAPSSGKPEARARRDLEWFWRSVALLMLAVIAWLCWMFYQISPRPLATASAYAKQASPALLPVSAAQASTDPNQVPAGEVVAVEVAQGAAAQVHTALAGAKTQNVDALGGTQKPAAAAEASVASDPGLKLATKISALPDASTGRH